MDLTDTIGTPEPEPHKHVEHIREYWIIFWGAIGAYMVLLASSAALFYYNVGFPGFNLGILVFILGLGHFLKSWGMVDKDEWGVLFFYGRVLRKVNQGPYFKPWLLMQIEKAPRIRQQRAAPGEPEQIFNGDDKLPLPKGMVRPIRITNRAPKAGETGHLDVQATSAWTFYVQFQILDIIGFFAEVGSFENAWKMIEDTGKAVLAEFAADRTLNGMIVDLPKINEELDDRIRTLTNKWHMEIFEAKAPSPDVSHELAVAMRDLPVARLVGEQTRVRADANAYETERSGLATAVADFAKGKAAAESRKRFLVGEAEGLEAKMIKLGVSGETIVAAEFGSDALANANTIVAGATGGLVDVIGAVPAIQAALAPKGGTKTAVAS